jgi:hypothetical protein
VWQLLQDFVGGGGTSASAASLGVTGSWASQPPASTRPNAGDPQLTPDKVGEVEVVEVERIGRRRRRDRVEIHVPPGIAVVMGGSREGTKIVLLGFVGDERQGRHGDADEGI